MLGYTERGMQLAQSFLVIFFSFYAISFLICSSKWTLCLLSPSVSFVLACLDT